MEPCSGRRLRLPQRAEYGAGEGEWLAWETVSGWLGSSRYYWLATTRPDGRPHAVPIWAVWAEERLWFTTSPETVSARNLDERAEAVIHAESAAEVAIVEGEATRPPPGEVPAAVVDSYEQKYGWRLEPDDPGMPYFVLTPRRVLAWSSADIRGSSRRWSF
jgi:hypothetical protein